MQDDDQTVFVVDDDEAVCDALQSLLESEGLRAAVFRSADEFLTAYRPGQPGCLVLDVRMRGMSGLELQAKLVGEQLSIPIIIISGHGDIPMAVRALKAGALDFLEKPVDPRVLLARIRHALGVEKQWRRQREQRQDLAVRLARLTPRERVVMNMVVAGRPSKRIAAELGVTLKTVEAHRKQVLRKMGVSKAVELVRLVSAEAPPLSSSPAPDTVPGGAPGD